MKKEGKSICIFSPKGGVGKTILAMNFAGVASLVDKKVLFIDFDLFNGCASMLINQTISKTIYNLADDLNNNKFENILNYIYKYNKNIDILCALKDPRQESKINIKVVETILNNAKDFYDLILIDTSSVLDEINLVTLDKSDLTLFIITNDIFNIKNMRNLINIFKDCEISNFKILMNNSIDFKAQYFSLSDIQNIISANIDYSISNNFFIKNITSYLYENKIPLLANGNEKKYKNEISNLNNILNDMLKDGEK